MKKIKVKIVANNSPWIDGKIKEIKDFFSTKVDLEFTITHTNFNQIPFEISQTHSPLFVVDQRWYDENVTVPDCDLVIFQISETDRKGLVTPLGLAVFYDKKPQARISIFCNENDRAYISGNEQGNTFVLFTCHEISHAFYFMLGKSDRTHEFFYSGMPKKVLEDFDFPEDTKGNILVWFYSHAWLGSILFKLAQILGLSDEEVDIIKGLQIDMNKKDYLNQFCMAIQAHEGWEPGSKSWRNKNPGNLRYAGQKLAIGKDKDNFAIFKSYEDGFATLKTMIKNACTGLSKIYKPEMTILEFFNVYAPRYDNNNSKLYAEFVAGRLGINVWMKIKELI